MKLIRCDFSPPWNFSNSPAIPTSERMKFLIYHLRKAFEIMQLLRGRIIRVEIDLGCSKPNTEKI
jgi:hypothetical protein